MAGKITQYPNSVTSLTDGDLFDVSDYDEVSAYESKKLTWANLLVNINTQITLPAGAGGIYGGSGGLITDTTVSQLANNLKFKTNGNAQTLYISAADGRVGIATTTPAGKLDVVGSAFISDNVGIGTTAPTEKLHVLGSIKMVDGNEGAGKVLTDVVGDGVGVWTAATDLNGIYGGSGSLSGSTVVTATNTNNLTFTGGEVYITGGANSWPLNVNTNTITNAFTVNRFGTAYFGKRGTTNFTEDGATINISVDNLAVLSSFATFATFTYPQNSTAGTYSLNGFRHADGGGTSGFGVRHTTVGSNDFVWELLTATTPAPDMILTTTGLGIGTTSPSQKLDVAGSIKMVDGNQALGKVLVSDANGVGSWGAGGGIYSGSGSLIAATTVTQNGNLLTFNENIVIGDRLTVNGDGLSEGIISNGSIIQNGGLLKNAFEGDTSFGKATTPAYTLDVLGDAKISVSGAADHTLRLNQDTLNQFTLSFQHLNVQKFGLYLDANQNFQLNTKMVISAAGNVGIGLGVNGLPTQKLDVAGTIQTSVAYNVGTTKVVGAQGAAVIDATDAATAITQLNALLAEIRTHGLIA